MRRLSRPTVAYVHDLTMVAVSFVLSLYLRVGQGFFDYPGDFVLLGMGTFTTVAAIVFWQANLYRGIWRYASLNDLVAIARAVTLIILIFVPAMFFITRLADLPRSFLVINWFVLMILLAAPRILYRLLKDGSFDFSYDPEEPRRIKVLLVGAGDPAEMFIQTTERKRDAEYRVVGIIDDSRGRIGRHIRGVEILGDLDSLPAVVGRLAEA
ncbi:MAG: polysaccharide biosynthesis protein, partial [Rhodospirillales bacterium]|nr:polysaccharide biosynthesis protein [Rhodospirillales bacterium]